jgi:hypothetical protein
MARGLRENMRKLARLELFRFSAMEGGGDKRGKQFFSI